MKYLGMAISLVVSLSSLVVRAETSISGSKLVNDLRSLSHVNNQRFVSLVDNTVFCEFSLRETADTFTLKTNYIKNGKVIGTLESHHLISFELGLYDIDPLLGRSVRLKNVESDSARGKVGARFWEIEIFYSEDLSVFAFQPRFRKVTDIVGGSVFTSYSEVEKERICVLLEDRLS